MSDDIKYDFGRRAILQGDLSLIPVTEFPDFMVTKDVFDPEIILAHSETGHHHVVAADRVTLFDDPDPSRMWLDVTAPVELQHLREEHNHAAQTLAPGKWLAQRQVVAEMSKADRDDASMTLLPRRHIAEMRLAASDPAPFRPRFRND